MAVKEWETAAELSAGFNEVACSESDQTTTSNHTVENRKHLSVRSTSNTNTQAEEMGYSTLNILT